MLRKIFIPLGFFIIVFNIIAMLRETTMLSSSSDIKPAVHQLKTITNNTISLEAKGKKTIVYFFAPWCQICHLSIGNLEKIYQEKSNIDVIAVALDYVDEEEIKAFTKEYQLTFPVAFGNERVKSDYKVSGYPSYYVLNEENTIIARSLGYSSELGLYLRSF